MPGRKKHGVFKFKDCPFFSRKNAIPWSNDLPIFPDPSTTTLIKIIHVLLIQAGFTKHLQYDSLYDFLKNTKITITHDTAVLWGYLIAVILQLWDLFCESCFRGTLEKTQASRPPKNINANKKTVDFPVKFPRQDLDPLYKKCNF